MGYRLGKEWLSFLSASEESPYGGIGVKLSTVNPLPRERSLNKTLNTFAGEGWGEGLIKNYVEDLMTPKP
jgi:hypothetical protein